MVIAPVAGLVAAGAAAYRSIKGEPTEIGERVAARAAAPEPAAPSDEHGNGQAVAVLTVATDSPETATEQTQASEGGEDEQR
jgi:hypothetical protein